MTDINADVWISSAHRPMKFPEFVLVIASIMALNPLAIRYLNRLSDHLFVLARLAAAAEGGDILWEPGATRSAD